MTDQDLESLREWEMILKNLSDFVRVDEVKGIKFIVRTDEMSGHHRPHLHVSTGSAEMSIAIDDAEILACSGKISPPQKKMAVKWIQDHKNLAVKMWNEYSNGITIEVA